MPGVHQPITSQDLLVELIQEFISFLLNIFQCKPLIKVTCCVLKRTLKLIEAHCNGQPWTPKDILKQDKEMFMYESLNDGNEFSPCRNQSKHWKLTALINDTVSGCDD